MTLVTVAIDVPLRQLFDYRVPTGMQRPLPGSRVRVPFGNRTVTGLVWPSASSLPPAPDALKPVLENLDPEPLLRAPDLALLEFASRYYHHPPGEVAAAALPPALRHGQPGAMLAEHWWLSADGEAAIDEPLKRKAPKQHELMSLLAHAGQPLTAGTLQTALPGWRRVTPALLKRGWVRREERAIADDWRTSAPGGPRPDLNEQQHAVLNAIRDAGQRFAANLLDGVTGSGKTEVFLHLIEQQMAADRQSLVLVPEIGLTPQLVRRFEQRLGCRVALLHSNLSDNERSAAWLAARNGRAAVIVGTRSAVFTPMQNPGLIIVDEEHDPSLKQHEGFRYHARDLAVWRASKLDIPLLLGSATPSLESLFNARQGRYTHLRLTRRAGRARPPAIRVIDTNRFNLVEGLSLPVLDAIDEHLQRGQQVLVYLNRRGYAPTLICSGCGLMADCRHCDAHMTMHAARNQLQCHHCGARRAVPATCSDCHEPMKPLGEGTERVEQVLGERFPDFALARIDSDTTARRGSMQAALADARSGKTQLLVGTQMLAKGHHFTALTLAVILNADQGFFASDFRASERLAQSIVQVAGRAGRGDTVGEVLIQSAFPEHKLLRTLVEGGYHAFAEQALAERAAAGWPPYRHIAVLHAAARDASVAIGFLHRARQALAQAGIETLGPAPASMLRRAGRYRYQLLLQSDQRPHLQQQLNALARVLQREKPERELRWSLDVDPQSEL